MSGYATETIDDAGVTPRFLAKPFTPDTLLRAVDEALAEASPRSEQ
jgi:FixJ family two-component response regulator